MLSVFLSAGFFLSQPRFDLSWNLSFLTRITLGCWVWIWVLVLLGVFSTYTFVSEYCWHLAKNETSSLGCFFSILCLLRCHLVTPSPYSTWSSEVSFWALDLLVVCPEAHTACKAAEEVPALTERVRAIAVLPPHCIFNLFPCCAVRGWGREGGRSFGLTWGVGWLGVWVLFVFGFFFLNLSVNTVSNPRPANLSDGAEIQCPIVTTPADSTFMWPLLLFLHGLLRIEFLQSFYHSVNTVDNPDRSDILGTGYDSAGSPPALVKRIVPTCRSHVCSVTLSPSMLPSSSPSACECSSKKWTEILHLCHLYLKRVLLFYVTFCSSSSLRNFNWKLPYLPGWGNLLCIFPGRPQVWHFKGSLPIRYTALTKFCYLERRCHFILSAILALCLHTDREYISMATALKIILPYRR